MKRAERTNPEMERILLCVALLVAPLVTGTVVFDVVERSGGTLGAVRSPPPNLAIELGRPSEALDVDVAPDLRRLDDPVRLPFEAEAERSWVDVREEEEEEEPPKPTCDPAEVIRDSFKIRRRCGIPQV